MQLERTCKAGARGGSELGRWVARHQGNCSLKCARPALPAHLEGERHETLCR